MFDFFSFGFLAGYRAKIAGVGLMLAGAGGVIGSLFADGGPDWTGAKVSGAMFLNGLGIIGIRLAKDEAK